VNDMQPTGIMTQESSEEKDIQDNLLSLLKESPIPGRQLLSNLGLFLTSKNLARILVMEHMYREAMSVPGVIMEFGCRWGQNLALFTALRGIYESFNRHKKVIGFDTFAGFPSIHKKDGESVQMFDGFLSVTDDYDQQLNKILKCHESLNPLSHLKKYEIMKGDAPKRLKEYLEKHPETIIALAYFDLDLYQPTFDCLELIKNHLTKGSVLGFDELNDEDAPGETVALQESLGLKNLKLLRLPYVSRVAYARVELHD
jgi:hypothetical protein